MTEQSKGTTRDSELLDRDHEQRAYNAGFVDGKGPALMKVRPQLSRRELRHHKRDRQAYVRGWIDGHKTLAK